MYSYLYKNVLPKYGIKKVHYRCDGAGNFSGYEAKSTIALWSSLANIDELTYKTMVPGCGKTNLDGMFGVLTRHLCRIVDGGKTFRTASELFDILVKDPLNHTEVHLFQPKRNLVKWNFLPKKTAEKMSFSNYYLLEHKENKTTAKSHSRHGSVQNMTDNDFHAGRLLGTIDEREHTMKTLVLPSLKLELTLRGVSYGACVKKEDYQSLLLRHMNNPILENKCNLQELNSPEMHGLCRMFDLKPSKINVSIMTHELKRDGFVDENGELSCVKVLSFFSYHILKPNSTIFISSSFRQFSTD